jgi:hypothetical protein
MEASLGSHTPMSRLPLLSHCAKLARIHREIAGLGGDVSVGASLLAAAMPAHTGV